MKVNSLRYLWRKAEPWVVVLFLLLLPTNIAFPFTLTKVINAAKYLIVILLFLGCWKRFIYIVTRDVALLLLLVVAIASIFWSVAPGATSDNIRGLVSTIMFAAYLATRYTPQEQTELFARYFIIFGFLNYIAILLFPSYGIDYSGNWIGLTTFKATLASMMSLAGILALINAIYGKKFRFLSLLGFGLATIAILFSKSSTSLICFITAILVLPLQSIIKYDYKSRVFIFTSALLICMMTAGIVSINLENTLNILDKDPSFTGRVPLWGAIIEQVSERPLLGYGYGGAMWKSDYGKKAVSRNPEGWPRPDDPGLHTFHSHNGYLEIFTELGWIGLSFLIVHILVVLSRVIFLLVTTKRKENLWWLQLLIFIIVFNITEGSTIFRPNQMLCIVYVTIAISSAIQKERLRRHSYLIEEGRSMKGEHPVLRET